MYLPKGRITCLLGPFGHQERVVVNAFDAIIMSEPSQMKIRDIIRMTYLPRQVFSGGHIPCFQRRRTCVGDRLVPCGLR